jgi:excisionase family DNA binding protein
VLKLHKEAHVITTLQTESVYTIAEVASALKISTETVRRRIVSGELHAIEIGGDPRRQYRILARDLSAWIGVEAARAIFGIGQGLDALREAFAGLNETERLALIDEAQIWARSKTNELKLVGRAASLEEIKTRFPTS